jgi:hypothetical protein
MNLVQGQAQSSTRAWWSRWRWIGAIAIIAFTAMVVVALFIRSHAEPIIRARVIETLQSRFHSPVELRAFHVWVADGLEVSGEGLKIFGETDPNIHEPGFQPLILIEEFHFHTGFLSLLRSPMHIKAVGLKGLILNIPPAGERRQIANMRPRGGKMKIFVDEFVSEDAQLVINTSRTDKLPLEFDIRNLTMRDIGPGQPMRFDATLTNPKPVGDIASSGQFGPWQPDQPRDTPVRGNYTFSNADLGTIKGIGGILSSAGQYDGTLGKIVVDGKTETPDFRLAVSGHPVPLQTEFHAIVDGTSGNTYLEPVRAKLLNSSFTASGSVVRVKNPHGHEVKLDIVIDRGRIDDLLQMAVRTEPPIMTGTIGSKIKFDLPASPADVADRLRLAGSFQVSSAHFTNEKIQDKVDALSMRSQGKPKLANDGIPDNVHSDLQGIFLLKAGVFSFSQLDFQVPGTKVSLSGDYSLDGNKFDFHGKVRMDAKLSHMVTGWKSIVLKPVDPFFSKNGAGTEVPIKITGTKSEPHIGWDRGHKEEKPGSPASR